MKSARFLTTVTAIGISLSACDHGLPIVSTGSDRLPTIAQADTMENVPDGDPMLRIGRDIPGFSGLYVDSLGSIVVRMQDLRGSSRAREILAQRLPGRAAHARMRFEAAEFDFQQLHEWKTALRDALTLPGAVYLDADERANRVVLGISDERSAPAIRQMIARHGIDARAVQFRRVPEIYPVVALHETMRPTQGGTRINYLNAAKTSGNSCTMGFNGWRPDIGQVFVTASHCSSVQGGTEGTLYYQGLATDTLEGGGVTQEWYSPKVFIGTEYADPVYVSSRYCPAGRRCRHSDSALGRYTPEAAFKYRSEIGFIARPTAIGSVFVDPLRPRFVITYYKNASNPLFAGDKVHKVGNSTGWTTATITSTCLSTNQAGTDLTLLCQQFASGPSVNAQPGDSGSPVFYMVGEGTQGVDLAGLLWGTDITGQQLVFSTYDQVHGELVPAGMIMTVTNFL